ncbi:MAG TPA: hypothetical protein VH598_04885, partial [Verrucomicrobiae bacterium]|nr:hypothetical protein [Verrucomicrobiae bacterium]
EVGTIKIVRIGPKLSFGETIDDSGILVGAIVRLKPAVDPVKNPEEPKPNESTPKSLEDNVKKDL